MKTVQEWVRELDREQLTETYFRKFPIQYEGSEKKEALSVKEIKNSNYQAFEAYIGRICKMETVPDEKEDRWIFCCCVIHGFPLDEYCYDLFSAKEIMENGFDATAYDFIDEGHDHIMGYYVANTALTREPIYDVIAAILYDASFFGYFEEGHEEARNDMEEAMREEELQANGWKQSEGDMELRRMFESSPLLQKAEELEVLAQNYYRAERDYSDYFRKHEIEEIIDELTF